MNSARRSYKPPENSMKRHNTVDDDDIDAGKTEEEFTMTSEPKKSTFSGMDSDDGESGAHKEEVDAGESEEEFFIDEFDDVRSSKSYNPEDYCSDDDTGNSGSSFLYIKKQNLEN